MNVEPCENLFRFKVHAPPVQEPKASFFSAKADIFGYRSVRDEVDLLINRTDSAPLRGLWGIHLQWSAIKENLDGIFGVVAGKNLDHRRLAGPVLSDQRMNFAPAHFKRRSQKRGYAIESFVDSPHGQQGSLRWQRVGHAK